MPKNALRYVKMHPRNLPMIFRSRRKRRVLSHSVKIKPLGGEGDVFRKWKYLELKSIIFSNDKILVEPAMPLFNQRPLIEFIAHQGVTTLLLKQGLQAIILIDNIAIRKRSISPGRNGKSLAAEYNNLSILLFGNGDEPLARTKRNAIIGINEKHVTTTRSFEPEISSRRDTTVLFMDHDKTVVAGRILIQYIRRFIRRAIVNADELHILQGLINQAIQASAKVILNIVDGHDNRN